MLGTNMTLNHHPDHHRSDRRLAGRADHEGGGFGLIGDIIVGIIGGFIGGWLWGVLHLPGIGPWWLTSIISATIGACILVFIIRLVKRA